MKKIITFLFLMFLLNIKVDAASICSYAEQRELNSIAGNVKVSYEIVEEEVESELYYVTQYFKISIVNVTEDLYVTVKNNINDEVKTFTKDNAVDGIITFNWDYLDDVTNFTVEVYSSENTNCPDEKYKVTYVTTPRYNEFSNRTICLDYADFYMCEKFVTFDKVEEHEFFRQLDKFDSGTIDNEGEQKEEPAELPLSDKIINFIIDNILYICGGVILVGFISYTIYRMRTKKQRELGL